MKRSGIGIFILSIFLGINILCPGQDVHFSQFTQTPLLVNPALAGEFKGNGRCMLNYRNQWSSVTSNPYTTYAVALDRSFLKDVLAAGIMAFSDKAGDAGFGITQVMITLASKVEIGRQSYLKLGINGAWSQQSLDLNNLTWNSQFNGTIIDPSLNSGEVLDNEKFSYIDFSTGFLWGHTFENKMELKAGLSAYHVSRPVYSYSSAMDKLDVRLCLHADMEIPLPDKKLVILPSMLVMMQGPSREITAGGIARFTFEVDSKYTGYYKSSYLYMGAYYRYRDALIGYVRFDYRSQFSMGFSYDINVSELAGISHPGGGMEISLSWIIPEKARIQLQ